MKSKKPSRQRAYQLDHHRKGLCQKCTDRREPGRNLCAYHLEKDCKDNLARYHAKHKVQP